ncbi:hypothetical protein FANTH_12349 [Fusarium anthophilum]|uniref:Xylanolytic transcriptional activator regulatory domain-containing protein n=1 Tax=Fusarium anthophilum TaxID=48485 RepID=A0A8H4YTR0_9HYPO|nr:hypothetical protein FANTH_12349 [Fusarium anthophilum]
MSQEPARTSTDSQIEETLNLAINDQSGQSQQEQEQAQEQYNSIDMGHAVELFQVANTHSSPDKSPAKTEQDPFTELPAFIQKPAFPDSGYITFLQSQGVLSLPPIPMQLELVKSFIEFIYPRMPLLDLEDFLGCVGYLDGSGGQLSLVLYGAILFAGSTHIDQEVVCAYGYSDRRLLRRELYKRAQLLFDLDINQDKLVAVQAALLLTCRGVSDDEVKDSWYWVNTAITLGYSIGLHRTSKTADSPPSRRKHLTRLWWCCFVRDNILSLGMNRPGRIKDRDFNIPMLEVADLESDLLTKEHPLFQHGSIGPLDKTRELESAELCVQKTRLSVLINQILELQAEADLDGNMPGPANSTNYLQRVHAVDASLRSWKKALPRSCSYRPVASRDGGAGRTPVDVRRHLLHMVYYTALYTLHRPQFLPSSPRQLGAVRNPGQTQQISKIIVLESANNITRLAAELHQHNMDSNLPIAAITVLFPAISMHMLNMRSQTKTVRDMAVGDFRICMRILEKMQKLYSAAEATVAFLQTLLSQASLTGVVSRSVDQGSTAGQEGQADAMAILQALTTQTPQAMNRGVPMLSMWTLPEHEVNSARQPQVPDLFSNVTIDTDEHPPQVGATEVSLQEIPPSYDLEFDETQIDTLMSQTSNDWDIDSGYMDLYGLLSSEWMNTTSPFATL